jgi:N-acetylglutamate synthase-like GNAT family acetyltransferase
VTTIRLRRATAGDQKRINAIIRAAQINPMGLKWQNFVLAVEAETGEIVGTGQIKTHGDGSRELASIAVIPAYQRRGIAHQIIEHLIAEHRRADGAGPLYLTCRSTLGPFYEQFGFRRIELDEMTPYFKRLKRFANLFRAVAGPQVTLLVMKLDR